MTLSLTEDADTFEAAMHFVDAYVESEATSSDNRSDDELALSLALDGLPSSMELELVETEPALARTATKRTSFKRRPKRPASYNPNHGRSRQRKELLYLREKVMELEQEPKVLQSTRRPKTRGAVSVKENNPSIDIEEVTSPTNVKAAKVWKEMASHQLEQRLKSERENRQLKVMAEKQITINKSLHKLLQGIAGILTQGKKNCRC
ncbi:hypothetical protein P3T76_010295 [Phytophthora citrophthora]|uniref:Uncharacterized protein n=1 Tax=Phytophthora citrophthora TaxID=4793 RepID=A0AAD9LGG8_9STRA|nr:hypothetical protein P3T76_010295 [Phytophthora citrophthora]